MILAIIVARKGNTKAVSIDIGVVVEVVVGVVLSTLNWLKKTSPLG